jgi:hypothetical protein
MTRPSKLVADIVISPTSTPTPAVLPSGTPATIEINELAAIAFARAAVLIQRHGYMFCPDRVPLMFLYSGQVAITLTLAEPDGDAIAGAAESLAVAVSLQAAEADRNTATALAATEAHQQAKAVKAANAAELAAARLHVSRLEAANRKTS